MIKRSAGSIGNAGCGKYVEKKRPGVWLFNRKKSPEERRFFGHQLRLRRLRAPGKKRGFCRLR
jgi:hypothetical protein